MQIMSAHRTPDLEETPSITNPKPTVDIRVYGLYGCWEKQSRRLTVWSYAGLHQAEGLLHRTSIALSLARGLSQSDRLFPSEQTNKQTNKQKNSHVNQQKNKISPAQWRSCSGLETSISIPQPSLQKPGIEPRRKPQHPFKYGKSDTDVISELRPCKPTHRTIPQQKAVIQPLRPDY